MAAALVRALLWVSCSHAAQHTQAARLAQQAAKALALASEVYNQLIMPTRRSGIL